MSAATLIVEGVVKPDGTLEVPQSRVEVWRGGSICGSCSVSTPRSSNRAGGFPAPGSRTRPVGSSKFHTAMSVGWRTSVCHRVRDVQTHDSGVVRLSPISGLSVSSDDGP